MSDDQSTQPQFPEGFEIPESFEVAEQRVRDLAMFIWAKFPSLFEIPDGEEIRVPVPLSEVQDILEEMGEEFSSSEVHRRALLAVIGGVLTECVRPHLDHAAADYMNDQDFTDEELEEFGGSVSGSLDVLWYELFPQFSEDSPIGRVMAVAGLALAGFFNSMLWDDPSWDMVWDTLETVMGHYDDRYVGAIGFLAVCAYIRVAKFRELPNIAYYVSTR